MTACNISVEFSKENRLSVRFDILAREDATDDELKIAKLLQEMLIVLIEQIPDSTLTRKEEGVGHDLIRAKPGGPK